MAIEELDDVAEEMASKLGIYGEERSVWVSNFCIRIRALRDSRLPNMDEVYRFMKSNPLTSAEMLREIKSAEK